MKLGENTNENAIRGYAGSLYSGNESGRFLFYGVLVVMAIYTLVEINGRLHIAEWSGDESGGDDPNGDNKQKHEMRECEVCRGTGISPQSGRQCLRCGGTGVEFVPITE